MAVKKNCGACQELQDYAPNFVQNGITDTECTSLKNNTGLNPSLTDKHKDCDDLKDINDCFVGNMADIIDAFDTCDWKDYMKRFVPNEYHFNYALVCAICGMWERIEKLECLVEFLFKGYNFKFTEETNAEVSHVVAGKGISFRKSKTGDDHATDIYLNYIAGGLIIGAGSLNFYTSDFEDVESVLNFDNDGKGNYKSKDRKGNAVWGSIGDMVNGGELLYEIRIHKTEDTYKVLKKLYGGQGQSTGGNGYLIWPIVFDEGNWAYGQHGWCDSDTGKGSETGYSDGHVVPDDWVYVQVRMRYIMDKLAEGKKFTPKFWMGVRFNQNAVDC